MNNKSIGVFDSGLGGLTVVKEIMEELPSESIVYFGDTGRVPYGSRSNETIKKYAFQDIRFLLNFDIKIIIIACGTASSVALESAREKFDIPIIGVVYPASAAAVKTSQNKRIGVIGTHSTINSCSYVSMMKHMNSSIKTFAKACPLFVPLVENGYIDNEVSRLVASEYLSPFKKEDIDTLILGCTHYPLLKNTINDTMGKNVKLIDPGVETAKYIKQMLHDENMLALSNSTPEYKYYVSDCVENFSKQGSLFLQKQIKNSIEKIDIEKY